MSYSAISSATQPRELISPNTQLARLREYAGLPTAGEISAEISKSGTSSPSLARIMELPGISSIISEYAEEELSVDFTNWYTALKIADMLPAEIPALPRNIVQIADGKCVVWSGLQKRDGTHCKIRDTWSLSLKPSISYSKQVQMVEEFRAKAFVDFDVPSFIETITACFTRRLTEGECDHNLAIGIAVLRRL